MDAMKIFSKALEGVAIVEAGDLAYKYGPDWMDFGNFPIREYGGAFAGDYAAHWLLHTTTSGGEGSKKKPDMLGVLTESSLARFASDFVGKFFPLEIFGLPVGRWIAAGAAVYVIEMFKLPAKVEAAI